MGFMCFGLSLFWLQTDRQTFVCVCCVSVFCLRHVSTRRSRHIFPLNPVNLEPALSVCSSSTQTCAFNHEAPREKTSLFQIHLNRISAHIVHLIPVQRQTQTDSLTRGSSRLCLFQTIKASESSLVADIFNHHHELKVFVGFLCKNSHESTKCDGFIL